jgi:hypothetical protein
MSMGEMGNLQAPLGYPTPRIPASMKKNRRSGGLKEGEDQMGINRAGQFGEQHMKDRKGLGTKSGLGTGDGITGTYSERQERLAAVIEMMVGQRTEILESHEYGEEHEMLRNRLGVIDGRLKELIEMFDITKMEGGSVELDPWMKDKITMIADYMSTVTDSAVHGGGTEIEYEIEPKVMVMQAPDYAEGEPDGSPKFSKKEAVRSHREQQVPHCNTDFAEMVKEACFKDPGDDKMMPLQGLYGEKKADKDYDGDGVVESGTQEWKGARDNAIKKRKKAEKAGITVHSEKKGLWANIHAKRERIKKGSGERMRKPGDKGAPSAKDLKDSQEKD